MIQITPQMRVLVAVEPADFRKGIDGLARLCRAQLQSDPFSGAAFVFRNRRRTAIKALVYDGQGFWLWLPQGPPRPLTAQKLAIGGLEYPRVKIRASDTVELRCTTLK